MLTAPNWLASVRMLSTMLYPEALVDGWQFSVRRGSYWECVVGERADRSPRRCQLDHMKAWWTREPGQAVRCVAGGSTTCQCDGRLRDSVLNSS